MKRCLVAAAPVLLVLLAGCAQSPPTLAGGKPVGHWVESLRKNPDPKARKQAAFKLGNVGPTDPAALPALVAALKDQHTTVRCEAILALVKFGPAALDAIPVLSDLREHDGDDKVRGYAAKALEKLQGKEYRDSPS